MSNEVKRYDLVGEYNHYIGEDKYGDYVKYDDYEKLKAQLEKCEAALKEYADPETWKNVGEYGVDTWILRDDQGNLARQYFKEKEQV